MKELIISSSMFMNNGWMPDECSGYGNDISPDIRVEDIPDGTQTLAIILDDLDHPVIPEFNHWIAWNIPCSGIIPGALGKGKVLENPIHIEQGIGYGKNVYRGPKPPFNGIHRYRFQVYALDSMLQLDSNSKKKDLKSSMDGHVLAEGEIIGIYQKKHE